MSGYRTLHRISPPSDEGLSSTDSSTAPIWRVCVSPCSSPSVSAAQPPNAPALRVLAAGATNVIRAYSLSDKTNRYVQDVLDASAMTVICTEHLVSSDHQSSTHDDEANRALLGFAALDIARNYCGDDATAGNEIVVSSKLGGSVSVWLSLHPVQPTKSSLSDTTTNHHTDHHVPKICRPLAEFTISPATGTTIAIRPPTLANYYSKRENDILVLLGCADGAVILCHTGVLAARPGHNIQPTSTVVGDSSSPPTSKSVSFLSNSTPGEIVATIGQGHACVLSITWHPTIPNTFAVGRKDGSIDVYSTTTSEYNEEKLAFQRMHQLVHSTFPIRALAFSQPDGAVLFAGDDSGKLYMYDVSLASSLFSEDKHTFAAMTAPVKLVACALTAHKGWVMSLTPFPDGRRVATCGSDRSVRVWDCGMGLSGNTPLHSFDGVHSGWIWDVACGTVVDTSGSGAGRLSGKREKINLISCGNDGILQVYSCDE